MSAPAQEADQLLDLLGIENAGGPGGAQVGFGKGHGALHRPFGRTAVPFGRAAAAKVQICPLPLRKPLRELWLSHNLNQFD
jgi:hypothetical protein